MTRRVHDHGPTEGRGLDCPERRLADGQLRGACLPDVDRTAAEDWQRREELHARVDALHRDRGLSDAMAQRLKDDGDLALVAEVERATDDQIEALNQAGCAAVDFEQSMRSVEQTIRDAHAGLQALQDAITAHRDGEPLCEHRVAIDIEDFSMDPPSLAPVITVTGRLCVHCHTRLPLPTEETPQ